MAVAWLGYMAGYALKTHPAVRSRVVFYGRRAVQIAQWRAMYPHLPTWAQEAAQVRGLAPVESDDTIDLSVFRA